MNKKIVTEKKTRNKNKTHLRPSVRFITVKHTKTNELLNRYANI